MLDLGFGSDSGPPNYAAIAKLVANMEPRALTNEALPDVITILEYLKNECIERHRANEKQEQKLKAWETELNAREKKIEIRQRAVNLVITGRKGWLPWR